MLVKIQQVYKVLEKFKNEIVSSTDLEINQEIFITLKKLIQKTRTVEFFLAACSLFFFSTFYDIKFDAARIETKWGSDWYRQLFFG